MARPHKASTRLILACFTAFLKDYFRDHVSSESSYTQEPRPLPTKTRTTTALECHQVYLPDFVGVGSLFTSFCREVCVCETELYRGEEGWLHLF